MKRTHTYMPGAEPFFQQGNTDTACLILHGFMASPGEVRWLAAHLAGLGYTTCAPCLPGHGSHPSAMQNIRWADWLQSAQAAYAQLAQTAARVVVIGHSMGGLLALQLATQPALAGVVGLAVPTDFVDSRVRWSGLLKYVLPYTTQLDESPFPAYLAQEQARLGEPVIGRVRYERWSTQAIHQLYQLVQATNRLLPRVTAPLFLIYSDNDASSPPRFAQLIMDKTNSQDKTLLTLQKSGHILTQDCERERVFAEIAAFVARLSR